MEEIIIIGITGADGTGRTTFAKGLAKHYDGSYRSVHKALSKLFREQKGEVPNDRAIFEDFSNSLRFESHDAAFAVRGIIDDILRKGIPGIHVVEALVCPGEIDYCEMACTGKAQFILFSIYAYPEDRIEWINKSKAFKPVNAVNGAVLYAAECRSWFEAKEWQPNIDACLERAIERNRFYNDGRQGFVGKILQEGIARIDELVVTPP